MTRQRRARRITWWRLILAACMLGLVATPWPLGRAGAAAPALTVTPDRGPCIGRATLRGTDFPPGQAMQFFVRQTKPPTDHGVILSRLSLTVPADGAFTVELDLQEATPGCAVGGRQQDPEGTEYTIFALTAERGGPDPSDKLLAKAVFTVAASPATPSGLPNTGGGRAQGSALLPGGLVVAGDLVALLAGTALCYGRFRRWGR